MKKSVAFLVAAGMGATMLAGAANAETLRWARVGDSLTLDPHAQNEGPTHTLAHQVYEPLLQRDMAGAIIPALATDWAPHSDDPTIWVFKLREGVTFHGGEDFTPTTWCSPQPRHDGKLGHEGASGFHLRKCEGR
jgi:peptide/nickel transport system substrate-binding protein